MNPFHVPRIINAEKTAIINAENTAIINAKKTAIINFEKTAIINDRLSEPSSKVVSDKDIKRRILEA